MSIKVGDRGTIKGNVPKYLLGKRVEVLRVSKRTGDVTVKMLEDAGLYVPGSEVSLHPYEIERSKR